MRQWKSRIRLSHQQAGIANIRAVIKPSAELERQKMVQRIDDKSSATRPGGHVKATERVHDDVRPSKMDPVTTLELRNGPSSNRRPPF